MTHTGACARVYVCVRVCAYVCVRVRLMIINNLFRIFANLINHLPVIYSRIPFNFGHAGLCFYVLCEVTRRNI